jgi:hypothetical protein
LSERDGFGIMRVASQKEFMGKYQESGDKNALEVPKEIF